MATLTIDRGTTFTKRFVWTAAGTPVNLTGATAKAQIRDADGGLLLELNTTDGTILLGGSAGTIDYKLLPAQTADLEFSEGVMDCVITFNDGTKKRRLKRSVKVVGGVTQ